MPHRPLAVALAVVVLVGLLGVGVGTYNYLRTVDPVPATRLVSAVQRIPGAAPSLPWPARGSAAVGASEVGLVADSGATSPLPIASVAKAMTALVVIEAMPLDTATPGPIVQVSQQDVDLYRAERAEQSTVAVTVGEQLTERQLLEGLLIPSANNFADILARSVGTTVEGFVGRMNARATTLKMTHSHFADASGFSAQTVSTAGDLVNLALEFLAHPVLVQIASLPDVQLPVAGTVYNVDYALGKSGIFGIKTGSSGDAGACFLFAANQPVGGGNAVIVGAVLGVPTLDAAFEAAQKLIQAASLGFKRATVIPAGQRVAVYRAPWGSVAGIIPSRDVQLLTWPGLLLHYALAIPAATAPLAGGSEAGHLTEWVGDGPHVNAALVTDSGLFPPGRTWRITRISGTN